MQFKEVCAFEEQKCRLLYLLNAADKGGPRLRLGGDHFHAWHPSQVETLRQHELSECPWGRGVTWWLRV